MIIKVSDYFKISIDELLKNDVQTVKKLIMKKDKKEVSHTIASFMFFRNCYYLGIIQQISR